MRTLALFLVSLACGCTNGKSADSTDESSIQGGHLDSADPAVGMIWFQGGGFCSGSLIAPNVVLTAGHCVADPIDAFYTGAGKRTTEVGEDPVSGLKRHAVAGQVAHPSYDANGGCPNQTFDVGLVLLAQPITGSKVLTRATTPPSSSASCRIVGYGVHNTDEVTEVVEQKRAANVSIESIDQTSYDVLWKTGIADHGDSGGPLLCGEKIEAVTSCGTDGVYPDHKEAYYARVDNIGAWIDATIEVWEQSAGQ